MKKILYCWVLCTLCLGLAAQEPISTPQVTVKWAPTGLVLGSISLQGEYNFGKHSLTTKIGLPANTRHSFEYEDRDARFTLKSTSFLAGFRTYLSQKRMKGIYIEPFFTYVHQTAEGLGHGTLTNQPVVMNFTNDYNGFGIGAQLGAQFRIGQRLVLDLFFLGPQINASRNNFKAVEATNNLEWSSIQASEAERDIRLFLDKFPFIRNHVNVMVDKGNRTVTADFKGLLPGLRAGVSIGWIL